MTAEPLCELEAALGRAVRCPGDACAFWDEEGCVIAAARPEVDVNPELAAALLALREKLEAARLSV